MHPLEHKYGLSACEILNAIQDRKRLKVALEGAVSEVHLEKKLKLLADESKIHSYQALDADGLHDFDVKTSNLKTIKIEVKTCRNTEALQVELQKTRSSKADHTSRLYNCLQFDIVAVNLGKRTGKWDEFVFAPTNKLSRHKTHADKLSVMHKIEKNNGMWLDSLAEIIDVFCA